MIRFSETRMAAALGLSLLFVVLAAPAVAQVQDCRGWMRSCASVDVQADGDRLVLFAPNLEPVDEVDEGGATGAERLSPVPADPAADSYAGTGAAASSGSGAMAGRGTSKCDREDDPATPEVDKRGCRPLGALVVLALPASLFLLTPGDDVLIVEEGPGAPITTPGGPAGDGGDGNGVGSDDGETTDDDGSGRTGDTGGDDDTGGNNDSAANPNGTGTTGGGGGGNGGSGDDEGGGDDWGPFHPIGGDTPTGLGDLPPISQVPEPVSTTLFGLGLAGYAGAQLRRRRQERIENDEG